jgi:hypothetical protein
MNLQAFQWSLNTVLVAASSSTSVTPTQLSTGNVGGCYIANPSSTPVWIAFGSSAAPAASIPTTSAPSQGLCVLPGRARAFSAPPSTSLNWLSAVTSAGATGSVFATPGFGT